MATDDQPTPAAFSALQARFEQQSGKAQVYYAVMHAARQVLGSDAAASDWMNLPLPTFDGKTPAQLVADGGQAVLLEHIDTLRK
jgi:uncharacterized protein (DUF2384 family)